MTYPVRFLLCRAAANAAAFALVVAPSAVQGGECGGGACPPPILLAVPAGAHSVPGEIIVKLRGAGPMTADETPPMLPFRDADMLGLQPSPDIAPDGALIYRISLDALLSAPSPEALEALIREVAEELSARPDVIYVQPHWIAPEDMAAGIAAPQ